ncbi:hypothetical protein R9C00_20120 [Flammeovirgaceae bacterium SG7u.111]|nr:hypothetical protein [Flammeovirgaceae bacterium SG7u.132]WPO34008.1 hypothetical protein R9C00_20120 [Flammeovirgaceae bacterium SG7u.111]
MSTNENLGGIYALKALFLAEFIIAFLITSFVALATHSFIYLDTVFNGIGILNIATFVVLSAILAYLVGKQAKKIRIEKTGKRILISFTAALFITLLATLLTSVLALIFSQTPHSFAQTLQLLARNILWMAVLSIFPLTVASIWFAYKLGRK